MAPRASQRSITIRAESVDEVIGQVFLAELFKPKGSGGGPSAEAPAMNLDGLVESRLRERVVCGKRFDSGAVGCLSEHDSAEPCGAIIGEKRTADDRLATMVVEESLA